VAVEVVQVYRYARASRASPEPGRPEVVLATSGGRTSSGPDEHPRLFDGFLEHAEQSATGLLAVADVARTRFYVPPGMLARVLRHADPVITSDGDRLRFESLSPCCGVYARLDVLPDGLDRAPAASGTTNVDLNPPVRAALAGVVGGEPLHLEVGEDLAVTTLDAAVVERRVPLPRRWVAAFGEVQHACAGLRPVAEVDGPEARRFVQTVATGAGAAAPTWVATSGRGLRLTGRPGPGAVPLPGPDRLRALRPLLRHATGLRVYGPAESGAGGSARDRAAAPGGGRQPGAAAQVSAWELALRAARLVVVLSPERSRGFSGEGGALFDLADVQAGADARQLSAVFALEQRLDVDALAGAAGLPAERVRAAVSHLAAAGRVGFDLHEGAWFHRDLPLTAAPSPEDAPRLRDALALVESGSVSLGAGSAVVRGTDDRVVEVDPGGGYRCSCPWWAKHGGSRGPCKHVLAVHVVRGRTG
jgi:hypothetical protein